MQGIVYPEWTPEWSKHLFVSDLDGTLLDVNVRVPSESARIISELSHRGALISVATARTPATVDKLLAYTFTRVPAVVMTGAAEWNRVHRSYEHVRFIDVKATVETMMKCRCAGLSPFVYILPENSNVLDVYHNGALSSKEKKFVRDRSGLLLKHFHLDEPADLAGDLNRCLLVLAMGPASVVFPVAERLGDNGGLSVSAYYDNYNPGLALVEVLAGGVDKATAVLRLKEEVGAEHLTVFGDNLNDLSMMRVADTAVAVGNAVDEVVGAADIVIGANSDNSVAHYILDTLSQL